MLIDSVSHIIGNKMNLSYCVYLNESICPALIVSCTDCNNLVIPIVLINPLAWNRTETISLPVSTNAIQILDSNGNVIPCSVLPNGDNFTVSFRVELPPLGINTYFIAMSAPQPSPPASNSHTMENNRIQLLFDPQSNLLASIVDKETGNQFYTKFH